MSYRVEVCSPREARRIIAGLKGREANDWPAGFKGEVAAAICRNEDGSEAWAVRNQPNLITDYGRRAFMSNELLASVRIVTGPSTDTPLVERYAHLDIANSGMAQQSGTSITATVDATTLTRSWSFTFPTPTASRVISLIGLGAVSPNMGAYSLMAYTLLPTPKTQGPTQTLEVVYRVTMTPMV